MRHAVPAAVFVVLAFMQFGCGVPNQSEIAAAALDVAVEEATIRDVIAQRAALSSAGDVQGLVNLYTKDVDFKPSGGTLRGRGRDQVREVFNSVLPTLFQNARVVIFVEDVSFLTPTLALVNVVSRAAYPKTPESTYLSTGVRVMHKDADGAWRIRLHDNTRIRDELPGDPAWVLSRELRQMEYRPFARLLPDEGPPPTAADEQAIREIFAHHEAALKRGEAEAATATYTDDAELKSASGVHYGRGRAQIGRIKEFFVRRSIYSESEVHSIAFLRPRIALVHLTSRLYGAQGPIGPSAEGSWIMLKEDDGQWRTRLQNNTAVREDAPVAVQQLRERLEGGTP